MELTDDDYRRMAETMSTKEIAALLCIERESVQRRMLRLGILAARWCRICEKTLPASQFETKHSRSCLNCVDPSKWKKKGVRTRIRVSDEYENCGVGIKFGTGGRLSYWVQGGLDVGQD
jgi:hypothetical protein